MPEYELLVPRGTSTAAAFPRAVPADDPRWERLRAPFPAAQVGKLPRLWCPKCRDVSKSGRTCDAHQKKPCPVCRNNITTAHLHLDYVGHAAVTSRLLEVDPHWDWDPLAVTEEGFPLLDAKGNLWILLTVLGLTRKGYGTVDRNDDDSMKILIGDAIRNAAMRFGVALDLWSKEDLIKKEEAAAERDDEVNRGLNEDEQPTSGRNWSEEVKALTAKIDLGTADGVKEAERAINQLAREANEVGEFKGAAKSSMASLKRRIDQAVKKLAPAPDAPAQS